MSDDDELDAALAALDAAHAAHDAALAAVERTRADWLAAWDAYVAVRDRLPT